MNLVIFVFGVLLIGSGFVILIKRLHDRSVHETVAWLKAPGGDTARAVTAFVSLLVPIVTSIATGLAFVAAGVLGR